MMHVRGTKQEMVVVEVSAREMYEQLKYELLGRLCTTADGYEKLREAFETVKYFVDQSEEW